MLKVLFQLFLINICFADYPDYNAVISGSVHPWNLFIHNISQEDAHIGILDENLSVEWEVFSDENGMNFNVL